MNPKKRYTHIFFDLDNTLWDFKTNSKNAMEETFFEYKLQSQTNFDLFFDVYSKHNHNLWDKYRKKEVNKNELTKLRFQNTFEEIGIMGIKAEKMNELYLAVMPKQKELFPDVLSTLNYLKNRNYRLNIITNGFKEVQYRKIDSSGLRPFFEKIFISEEVKSHKPERKIFEYAIKSTNAKKVNSIMVGDDFDVDIMGAIQFGIDAVLFKPYSQKGANTKKYPIEHKGLINRISSFNALLSFF